MIFVKQFSIFAPVNRMLMYRLIIFLIALIVIKVGFCESKTVDLQFFNKRVSLVYDPLMVFEFPYKPNDDGYFEVYFEMADTTPYRTFLNSLREQKQALHLNDWLYFNLLKKSIDTILISQKEHMRNLFLWFILNKSEFETQLEFKGRDITVSVLTHDLVYGVPQSKGKGGFFIDLTSFSNQVDYRKWEPFRLTFNPNKGKKTIPFCFTLIKPPAIFDSYLIERTIRFSHGDKQYEVKVPTDSGYVDFLEDYPELSVLKHTELALSPQAYQSLIPYLKEKVSSMDSVQTIRFLMSFCRTGFKMKKSEKIKPGTPYVGGALLHEIASPEEVLFLEELGPEDITVLFYYLAKEVLNPEMVLLKYGKQVSLAINLHKKIGIPIMYNSKAFALCDVSENDDTVEIGQSPKSLAGKSPSFIEK